MVRKRSEEKGNGYRDAKGYWIPPGGAEISPLFQLPLKPLKLLSYLLRWGGYLWPWNALYIGLAFLSYFVILPTAALDNPLQPRWIGLHFLKNQALLWLVFGSLHLILIKWKLNGTDRKFNIRWMEKSKKFLFSDQVLDNIFWSCVSGGIIWTAYELLYFQLIAAGKIETIKFQNSPVWFVGLFLLLPLYRETHFYLIHRFIHWKPLLRMIHSVHHRNPNPGPWSGMSMHPVEHLLYFSNVLLFFLIPAHPVHMLFISIADALAPAPGHTGFDNNLFGGILPGGDYFHYLHHRHVSCNFGTPTAPWDKYAGSFYDGLTGYKEWKKNRKNNDG